MRWNNTHHISMKGYDVEIYVEDIGEHHIAAGIYSLLEDEWVKKPRKYDPHVDFTGARQKAENIEFQVSIVSNLMTAKNISLLCVT